MSKPVRDGDSDRQASARQEGCATILVGACPAATALLYRLLCLHPRTAYISRLEEALPWLPVSVAGRLRLRRYGSKLRWWFRDVEAGRGPMRGLAGQLTPADGERLYRHLGLAPSADWDTPPQRVAERLRERFDGQRQAVGASLMICHCSPNDRRVSSLAAIFPEARCVEVTCDTAVPSQAPSVEAQRIGRAPGGLAASRVMSLRYEDLVEEPIEQMRRVSNFLGLERRMDYEWALKALKLGEPALRWRSPQGGRGPAPTAAGQEEPLARSGYAS